MSNFEEYMKLRNRGIPAKHAKECIEHSAKFKQLMALNCPKLDTDKDPKISLKIGRYNAIVTLEVDQDLNSIIDLGKPITRWQQGCIRMPAGLRADTGKTFWLPCNPVKDIVKYHNSKGMARGPAYEAAMKSTYEDYAAWQDDKGNLIPVIRVYRCGIEFAMGCGPSFQWADPLTMDNLSEVLEIFYEAIEEIVEEAKAKMDEIIKDEFM
jgi:hypothetical protein